MENIHILAAIQQETMTNEWTEKLEEKDREITVLQAKLATETKRADMAEELNHYLFPDCDRCKAHTFCRSAVGTCKEIITQFIEIKLAKEDKDGKP